MIFWKIGVFGWSEKFYFPEIEIRWPKKKAFDHGNQLPLLFSLQRISRKRERERERARARGEDQSAPISSPSSSPREDKTSPTTAIDTLRDRAVDRDLANARSCRREIATLIAISPSRDRAGEIAIARSGFVFSGLWLVSGFVFSFLLFQTLKNIFRKIFWNATKHTEIFSFSRN